MTLPRTQAPLAGLVLALLLTAIAPAQRVVLPHGTGGVTPDDTWTVLRDADLQAETRPSDPVHEPARATLFARIAELRERRRTAEHVLFHRAATASERLVLVDTYSDEIAADPESLRSEDAIDRMKTTLQAELGGAAGRTARFVGSEPFEATDPGGITLRFEITQDGRADTFELTAVPAGERLQYFESLYPSGDDDAAAAAAAGAVAGILVAALHRRRQARTLMARSAQASAS